MSGVGAAATQQHQQFLSDYHAHVVETINPLRLRLRSLLAEWRTPTYWEAYRKPPQPTPTPVLWTQVRVKRAEAVVDKIARNPHQFPAGLSMASVSEMGDLLAGRVVVAFLPHLGLVDQELRSHRDLELWATKTPRAHLRPDTADLSGISLSSFDAQAKPWGSAALVYWLCFSGNGEPECAFELQVVTLLENAWGEVQRQLGYRTQKGTSQDVRSRFEEVGADLSDLEVRLAALHHELADHQNRARREASPADPLNAENLPGLLTDVGLPAAQTELEGMLKVLASRGVRTVSDLRARATPETISMIRATYLEEAGWAPTTFEVVATVAMLDDPPSRAETARATRLSIAYAETWDATVRQSVTPRDEQTSSVSPRRTPSVLDRLRRGDS
jgi:ppGpp synthetase/RelA/SpoT-type nucleotidyltranferase